MYIELTCFLVQEKPIIFQTFFSSVPSDTLYLYVKFLVNSLILTKYDLGFNFVPILASLSSSMVALAPNSESFPGFYCSPSIPM